MESVIPLLVVLGLVAVATLLGLVWRSQQGRIRQRSGSDALDLPEGVVLGSRATLLQFSTEVCAPCRATHTVLDGIANESADISHVDVDLTHRPDLASRFNILQTPTTFILDEHGVVRARIGGAAKRDSVRAELDRILSNEGTLAA